MSHIVPIPEEIQQNSDISYSAQIFSVAAAVSSRPAATAISDATATYPADFIAIDLSGYQTGNEEPNNSRLQSPSSPEIEDEHVANEQDENDAAAPLIVSSSSDEQSVPVSVYASSQQQQNSGVSGNMYGTYTLLWDNPSSLVSLFRSAVAGQSYPNAYQPAQDSQANSPSDNNTGNDGVQVEIPSTQALLAVATSWLPLAIILLLIFCWWHLLGTISLLFIGATVLSSNMYLQAYVRLAKHGLSDDSERQYTSQQGEERTFSSGSCLSTAAVALCNAIIFANWVLAKERLWYYIIFYDGYAVYQKLVQQTPQTVAPVAPSESLFYSAWLIIMVDSIIKLLGIACKAVFVVVLRSARPSNNTMGKLLSVSEYALQIYRALVPIPIYWRYFRSGYFNVLMTVLLLCVYFYMKGSSFLIRLANLGQAIRSLFSSDAPFGRYASQAEVLERGEAENECIICREEYKKPLLLECGHMFCEECASDWATSQTSNQNTDKPTCPVCRTEIRTKNAVQYADGSTSLMIMLM